MIAPIFPRPIFPRPIFPRPIFPRPIFPRPIFPRHGNSAARLLRPCVAALADAFLREAFGAAAESRRRPEEFPLEGTRPWRGRNRNDHCFVRFGAMHNFSDRACRTYKCTVGADPRVRPGLGVQATTGADTQVCPYTYLQTALKVPFMLSITAHGRSQDRRLSFRLFQLQH
jgi:hypothetical protein